MVGRVVCLVAIVGACGFESRVGSQEPIDAPDEGTTDAAIDAQMCGDCDDNDPCTTDACAGTQCTHTLLPVPAGCGGELRRCAGEATCYLQCTTARAWTPAETLCVAWGGHLATITSDAENACVDTFMTAQSWIGYYQDANDGEPADGWEWISGQPSTYVKWIPPQPNNNTDILPGGQDCAYADGAAAGNWFDHECTEAFHYVCEQ